MRITPQPAAARNAFAAFLMVAATLPGGALAADGQPNLLLPLVAAVAFGASAARGAHAANAQHQQLSIIPPHMHIPDMYAVDDNRDPARFAEPLDRDRMASFDLLPHAARGWMPSLIFDDESPQTLGHGSNLFRISFEYDF